MPTTPPAASVAAVKKAVNDLSRYDRQLQAMPHAIAVWIVECLAEQWLKDEGDAEP